MTEPILDPQYWKERLDAAKARGSRHIHNSVFKCSPEQWERIEKKHKKLLYNHIMDTESVLDAGCGYGRLLSLMPDTWCGDYIGVDLSPDFVEMARAEHPYRTFVVGDLRGLDQSGEPAFNVIEPPVLRFDWAVLISIRPMIIRNAGVLVWDQVVKELRRLCKRLLFLEYDPDDKGSVEV